ncbi:glycine betaine ABC transporter substrate-binding protein [Blastococcus atacamensis]|uniref:glycine betaine ABC transporter substrate-binding protein n=1 Tax=Blastococcus atacamensis TaxID=2070508 RepID=UPI000CEC6029|nr:glycine betaine ABC transporter substrate-binding protein [Blastococcus atacamensis]
MRTRIRYIVPLALVALTTAACGESGSSGTGGGADTTQASGNACAPVPGDQLVVLEDDQGLQNADNLIPAVNAAAAEANPALVPALDAVSEALTLEALGNLNVAVDVERQSPEDAAAAWVEENVDTGGLEQGSGEIVVGGGNFSEPTILANIYADVLEAAGFSATVQPTGNRELYLPALQRGEIQVHPEYLATVTEFLEGDEATQVASSDVDETVAALTPLAEEAGLVFGEPSDAANQNAFAVTREFADDLGVTTLSELADACGDGSLVLGGPGECPTRPFCQPGLEDTYGLDFAGFQEFDAGGPLTKAAIQQGEVSIGLVFTTDGSVAQ